MPSVAVIGSRGYPSYYGGFETAIRKIAPYLVDAGWDVTVYGRVGATRENDPSADARVCTRVTPGLETKHLSTLSYGLTSTLDAAARRPDVALILNVANGFFLPMLKARGIPTLVNVDGIEWERAKWSPRAKKAFRKGAKYTARWADELVFDARAIKNYWEETFEANGTFIPYGGDVLPALRVPDGYQHRKYVLVVARFVPENSIPELFQAIPAIAEFHPVVIVGSSGYGGELDATAKTLAETYPLVSWLGHVSNDSLLLALWQHAGLYFHGHSVGGTNPALVQAMAAGAPILARDTVYNREVLGSTGQFVSADSDLIAKTVQQLMESRTGRDQMGLTNRRLAEQHYTWTKVCSAYEQLLRGLICCPD